METCHTADGINLATLAGLLEDVQGYEAAIPAEQIVKRYCGLSASKCCCLINSVNMYGQTFPMICDSERGITR